MKTRLGAAAAVAGLFLAGAASAQSAPAPINPAGMTGPEVVAWLQAGGFSATLSTDNEGDPLIQSSAGGVDFAVLFYDCTAGRCGSLQFYAKFNMKTPTTADLMNQWNQQHRYLKAYVDSAGNANVQYDMNVDAGRTTAVLNDDFGVWTRMIGEFPTFIGW